MVDEAGNREGRHLLLGEVCDLVEDILPNGVAVPRSHSGGQKAADDAQHRAGQGAAQHLQPGVQDVGHGAPRRFDQNGQAAHVVGQGQHDKCLIEQQKQGEQHRQDAVRQKPAGAGCIAATYGEDHDVDDARNQHDNPEIQGQGQEPHVRVAQTIDAGEQEENAGPAGGWKTP